MNSKRPGSINYIYQECTFKNNKTKKKATENQAKQQ